MIVALTLVSVRVTIGAVSNAGSKSDLVLCYWTRCYRRDSGNREVTVVRIMIIVMLFWGLRQVSRVGVVISENFTLAIDRVTVLVRTDIVINSSRGLTSVRLRC